MAARRRTAARRNWPDNLYQNGAGYFWYKNPESGKGFGLGHDFKSAASQAKAANAELLRRHGDVDLIQRIDGGGTNLRAWCDIYQKTKGGKPATIASMMTALNAIRDAEFSKNDVTKITPKEIASFLHGCVEERGATMASVIRGRLLDVYRAAIEDGRVEVGKNPVESVFRPRPKVTRQRLTLDDFNRILAKASKDPGDCWIANSLLLALITGQRREDIATMKFSQIREGFLWIEQTKGQEGSTAKIRIPLSLRLNAISMSLDDVLRRCRDSVVSKSVIHQVRKQRTSVPGKALYPTSLSYAFQKMRIAAEIETTEGKTPSSFHEIRSLSARLYTEQYDEKFTQALLGHKSAEMTALYRDNRGREWTEIRVSG